MAAEGSVYRGGKYIVAALDFGWKDGKRDHFDDIVLQSIKTLLEPVSRHRPLLPRQLYRFPSKSTPTTTVSPTQEASLNARTSLDLRSAEL